MMKRTSECTLLILAVAAFALLAAQAQSTKGSRQQPTSGAQLSPVAQARQQQQQQQVYQSSSRPQTTTVSSTKRRPVQQQAYQPNQADEGAATEDPLSDSEPALYGSVAGAPGVDFPAYTRIPKTSFSCEGRGYDFGFYADEETGCQVYHVCWSGRRESFMCGVGTVFNQAILACDYWHSVDCSKSSQFYGVNSELGKAGAEPASNGGARLQPASGSVIAERRPVQSQVQTAIQQQVSADDTNFEQPQQQQQQVSYGNSPARTSDFRSPNQTPAKGSSYQTGPSSFVSQRQPAPSSTAFDYQQQQQQQQRVNEPTKKSPTQAGQRLLPAAPVQQQTISQTSTLATPAAVKRPRFNMDFNQKVNSLIDSPVRPPIKSPVAAAKQAPQRIQPAPKAANFAQSAVARAQQAGSQALNPGPARKVSQQQQQQVQTSSYDGELDEPQQVQQQQNFDDAPVQTSTVQSAPSYNRQQPFVSSQQQQQQQHQQQQQQQQQQITIHAGGSPDGSSAITTQFDTLTPVSQQQQLANQQDQTYESAIDDSNSASSDDFRSSGAKAAASHNQNWYIMRSI